APDGANPLRRPAPHRQPLGVGQPHGHRPPLIFLMNGQARPYALWQLHVARAHVAESRSIATCGHSPARDDGTHAWWTLSWSKPAAGASRRWCDGTVASASPRKRFRVNQANTLSLRSMLIPLALAQFVASFAGSNMNVAINSIATDLGTTVSGVQVAITMFLLTMAALMIPGSKLSDIWGRKFCFRLGLLIYGSGA